MKKFLCGLVIAGAFTTVNAAEIVVFEETGVSYQERFIRGDYAVNKDLGRAWVTLDFESQFRQAPGKTEAVKVPNMKYDNTTNEVIIESEEGRVVCAFEKRGLFGIKVLKATKDCQFKESYSNVTVDDGFYTRKVLKRTVTLSY